MPDVSEPKRSSVSAFVVCMNEQAEIERCLQSVAWCDEIIVIDSGSTDRTLELASKYTRKIFHKPWEGFVKQKRFGLEQCQSDWVLNIDADEEVSPELREEILEHLRRDASGTEPMNGFELLRTVFFLGQWWRKGGWYPEYRLRLCRRSATTWGGMDPHEHAEVTGKVVRLKCELRHYTYDDIGDQIRSLNSHSTAAALSLFRRGSRTSILQMIGSAIGRVLKFYFLRKGFLEGSPGIIVAMIEGMYAFLKYAKLWELQRTKKIKEAQERRSE